MVKIIDIFKNKNRIIPILVIFMLIVSAVSGLALSNTAYAIKVDGQLVGIVKHKSDTYELVKEIKDNFQNQFDGEIIIPQKITDEKVFTFSGQNKISTLEEIKFNLEKSLEIHTEAYALNVNKRDIVFVKDEQVAKNILDNIKDSFIEKTAAKDIKEIGFLENIDIMKKEIPINNLMTEKEALEYVISGEEKSQEYRIKNGDTIWDISIASNISIDDIQKLNPGTNLDKLQIDQKIVLKASKPFINIKTVENLTYEESIPFETEFEETSNLYIGDKKVKTKGQNGNRKITAEVVKVNGLETDRNILEDIILNNPQTQIILKGTSKRPSTAAYGVFRTPLSGALTSRYGSRWGGTHTGIDIAGSIGTPVVAADGGKVAFAGASGGGYGNLVIINHENGYQTYYAHLNTINTKKGERVARGQNIATVGATGRATGPHLHFEVRKNGVSMDPLKYVSY